MNGTLFTFFFSSRRRHTRLQGDWSSDVCSSDLDLTRVWIGIGDGGFVWTFPGTLRELGSEVDCGFVPAHVAGLQGVRSEERRVGKECRGRGSREEGKRT